MSTRTRWIAATTFALSMAAVVGAACSSEGSSPSSARIPVDGLVLGGHWDPFAFVDGCELATQRSSKESIAQALREIQEVEFNALLSHILSGT